MGQHFILGNKISKEVVPLVGLLISLSLLSPCSHFSFDQLFFTSIGKIDHQIFIVVLVYHLLAIFGG